MVFPFRAKKRKKLKIGGGLFPGGYVWTAPQNPFLIIDNWYDMILADNGKYADQIG